RRRRTPTRAAPQSPDPQSLRARTPIGQAAGTGCPGLGMPTRRTSPKVPGLPRNRSPVVACVELWDRDPASRRIDRVHEALAFTELTEGLSRVVEPKSDHWQAMNFKKKHVPIDEFPVGSAEGPTVS